MNAAGIDISKGKSMVSVMRPLGEVVAKPFTVCHTGSELKELADYIICCFLVCPLCVLTLHATINLH